MKKLFKDKQFRKILGNKIKNLRKLSGKTQVELAKELGFTSTGAISQVESGFRGLKVESIIKAARVFGVHPVVLITPYDLKKNEIEMVSTLFIFFEKWKMKPNFNQRKIEDFRRLLSQALRDMD